MSTLYAGPYCGEFGFEIMTWQANVRARAEQFDRVIVGCHDSSQGLYRDFASGFFSVPYEPNTSGSGRVGKGEYDLKRQFERLVVTGGSWMQGEVLDPRHGKFIKYGTAMWEARHRADVVIHARHMRKGAPKDYNLRRSAPQEWWDELVAKLMDITGDVCAIGLSECSLCPRGAVDLRGVSLEAVMRVLSNRKVIIGPSSGPIHLAALCDCPQVVWTNPERKLGYDRRSVRERLEKYWNPFKVQVEIIPVEESGKEWYWMPDQDEVLQRTEAVLCSTSTPSST